MFQAIFSDTIHKSHNFVGAQLPTANIPFLIIGNNNLNIIFYFTGSFYARYPRHGKLISINKRHTGKTNKEFNMRHDWNSLLSDNDDMLMRHYTRDFFPKRESLVHYLNDYTKTFDLNVKYNTEVSNISKVWNRTVDNNLYQMNDQHGNTYQYK